MFYKGGLDKEIMEQFCESIQQFTTSFANIDRDKVYEEIKAYVDDTKKSDNEYLRKIKFFKRDCLFYGE